MGTHPIFESDFDCLTEFMSDKNGGDDFMAEMAQFLKPGDFQRPSDGDSKKLKLKKPKKDKKKRKNQKKKRRKRRRNHRLRDRKIMMKINGSIPKKLRNRPLNPGWELMQLL